MKINKIFIAIIVLALIAGLVAGYSIWGMKKKESMDVKQLLKSAIKQVEIIEKKNRDLNAELQKSITESKSTAGLMKENNELKGQLLKAEEDRKELENKISEIEAKLSEAEKQTKAEMELKAADSNLKTKISELEKENQGLKEQLQNAQEDYKNMESLLNQVRNKLSETQAKVEAGEELKTLSADLQSRVTILQEDNERLKSILEKIGEISKGTEGTSTVEE